LNGAWFYAYEAKRTKESFFVVAEFRGEDLVLGNYSTNEVYEHEKRELNFRTKLLSDSQIIASGSYRDDFIVHVDWDHGTIRLGAFDCSEKGTCNFIKAPEVSLEDINGKWLASSGDGDLWLTEYSENSLRHYSRIFDYKNKTYEEDIESCEFRLESGFLVVEMCGEQATFFSPITKYSPSKIEIFESGDLYELMRVRSDYDFPDPPSGYKEAATK